jgi:hypothetical protein
MAKKAKKAKKARAAKARPARKAGAKKRAAKKGTARKGAAKKRIAKKAMAPHRARMAGPGHPNKRVPIPDDPDHEMLCKWSFEMNEYQCRQVVKGGDWP